MFSQTILFARLSWRYQSDVSCFYLCCGVQVLDYGISLKLNDGHLVIRQQHSLIKAMMAMKLGVTNIYIRSTILNLLIVLHQRKENLPTWQMFNKFSAMYNEESGK